MNNLKILSNAYVYIPKISKNLLPITIVQQKRKYVVATVATQPKPDWNRAVSEAEKIVGYPTSFLSLRWLLSDEIANVALHLRRLVGSNHPLLRTAKNLLYSSKNNMQAWGLIVLLISKTAGHCESVSELQQDKTAGVLHSQRALAEVTEMIRTAHLVHKGLINFQPEAKNQITGDDLLFGNKIALLSGDYLLSNSCAELANLREQDVVELISSALRDLSEAEFVGRRDLQNNPLPSPPQLGCKKENKDEHHVSILDDDSDNLERIPKADPSNVEEQWTLQNVLSAGSLLGKACQGALYLAGHTKKTQHKGYLFGKHLALAWQACVDLEPFLTDEYPLYKSTVIRNNSQAPFSLASAPVLFTLKDDHTLYKHLEVGASSVLDVDYEYIWNRVKQGPGIESTRTLQIKHTNSALGVLDNFPASDAKKALTNIIAAIQNV